MLLHTALDGTVELPRMPEPTPPAGVFGATDSTYEADDIRAVVTVQIAMTRDMLAVALDFASGTSDEHPDTWSVQYIRESVELSLTHESVFQLEQDAPEYADIPLYDSSVTEQLEATYRAVDRAYPYLAPKGAA